MAKDEQEKHKAAEASSAPGKISRKEFEKELAKLQVELVRLQTWVQATGARVIVVFEGRDTAGKGGVISRITARTSPRVYRHVALPVIHFAGMAGEESLKRYNKELDDFLSAKRFTPLSPPTYAFYNPPWTLPLLRRNEVLVEIAGPAN